MDFQYLFVCLVQTGWKALLRNLADQAREPLHCLRLLVLGNQTLLVFYKQVQIQRNHL